MTFKRSLIIVLFYFFIAKSENTNNENVGKNSGSVTPLICVLDYLSSNSNGDYKYKSVTVISSRKKGDIIDLTVLADVDCLKTYPEIPCNERELICHAFIGENSDHRYQVHSDVNCTPKFDTIPKDMDGVKIAVKPEIEKIDLSSETMSPAQGDADFVAVHKANIPCLGCPFDMSTDAEGVEELINTAVKHIESERSQRHKIVNIRRLQQQVVAGLKYILLAEVAPTMCDKDADLSAPCILDTSVEPFICEITFIQKPWISRSKHVVKNNCTVSQEFEPLDLSKRDDINNEILPSADLSNPTPRDTQKPVPNYDAMAQTGNMEDDMDAARLADLESQILFGGMFESPKVSKVEQSSVNVLPNIVTQPEFISDLSNPTPRDTLKPVSNYDAMAQNGNMEEDMDDARLADLESPILFGGMFESPKVSTVEQSPVNVMPNTVAQPEFISVEEPTPMIIDNEDDLKVEPLNIEQEHVYRMPVFGSVPVVDESEPVVTLYVHQNDEPLNASDENTVLKATDSESIDFERTLQVEDRLRRELKEDSNSDSNSDSSESKGEEKENTIKNVSTDLDTTVSSSVELVKAERADSSEESSESNESSKEKIQRVRRETNNTSEESSDTSENKLISIRQTKKPSDKSSESNDSSKETQRVKRETQNTSEENSESSNSTEERKKNVKRPKRAKDNKNDSSSSSSSSSSGDDDDNNNNHDNNIDKNTRAPKSEKNKKDNDDSSSSSSDDDDDNNNRGNDIDDNTRKSKSQETKKDNKNDDSSSSSSSSSSSDDDNNNRHRRSIGQMEKISSDEKVIVRDLADFAAATLDNIDDDHHKRVILQILGAKKLKLDGIYYQIILRLGISHCHENEHNENCREKLQTNLTKICKVQVHVEDDYSNPKVVKSQCQNIKKDENDRNRTNYSRYRRSMLVGGNTPTSTDDPDIKRFVSATLEHLDSQSDQPNKYKAVEIISATTQVVAGVRYVVTVKFGVSDCAKSENKLPETCGLLQTSEPETCTIDVWERSWLNQTIYRVNCNDKVYRFGDKEEENTRIKRETPLLGAPRDVTKDSKEILSHLERSLIYLDSKSVHENKYVVDEVLSATRQVVAGSLTRIRASVALSDCKKGSDSKNCKKLDDTQNQATICKFTIWEQPWLHFTQTNVTCDDHQEHSFRRKRSIEGLSRPQLLGADEELSTDLFEAKKFIKMALEYIQSKSETSGKYELTVVNSVSRRIVAGTLWTIAADIALCKEVDLLRSSFSICPDQSQHKHCQFKVLDQPWQANGLTINVTCDNDDQVYSYTPVNGVSEDMLSSFDHEKAFTRFLRKYDKVYEEAEYNHRLKVFRDNVNKIALLNKYEKGTAQYGFTQFADLTEKEFSQLHGYRSDLRNDNDLLFAQADIPNIKLPKEFDWRTKGAVTEVKNQGLCGSCWAFSVTGNVEGQYAIKHGKLLEFSEQELVDCDKVDQGCNGGLMDNAYRVIEKLGGLETESDYPYEGDDEKCHFNPGKVRVQLTGALNISHNETDMAKWLVQNGPISIAINANAMQFYMGGVSHPWKMLCNPNSLDHGVLIVGYGVHKYTLFNKTLPYWIVKNSWSTSWGEQGYYRVYRGDGTCGVNQTPSSAIVA